MLRFQLSQAPLRFGLAEGVDPHQVPFGTLLTAENACWVKSGCLGKRSGSAALTQNITGGGTITAAKRLIVRGDELALTTGSNLYSYAQGAWVDRGRHPEIGLTWTTLQDSQFGARTSDAAYLSDGRVVHAWVSGDPTSSSTTGTVYYEIVDLATGAVLQRPAALDTLAGYRVRVLATGTTYAILWVKDGTLWHYSGTSNLALKADAANSDPDKLLEQSFDACVIGTDFVVAYALDAGGIQLVRYSFVATPVQQATAAVTGEASVGIHSISVAGASAETLYIGYANFQSNRISFAAANPSTLAQTVAPTHIQTVTSLSKPVVSVCRRDATSCVFCYSFNDSTDAPIGSFKTYSITNAGVATAGRDMTFMRMLSRPFAIGTRFYALVTTDTTAPAFQAITGSISGTDTFLVDVTAEAVDPDPHRMVGKIELFTGGIWGVGHVSTPIQVSSTRTLIAAPFLSAAASNLTGWRQGVRLVEALSGADLPADMWGSSAIGQEVYLNAGVMTAYDGLEPMAYGWAHPSFVNPTNTVAAAAGGTMATGTYLYNTVPERRSHVGVLHRGPTAISVSKAVTGPTGQVTIHVAPVSLNYSPYNKGITAIYRTVVNGVTPQRLSVEPLYGTITNGADPPFSVVDTEADAAIWGLVLVDLSTRPAIYTAGGELDDYQPPACLTKTLHQNRIWLLAGDGRTVWISKDHSSNPGTAPGFHPNVTLAFDRRLTTLCPMDEKLIAFAEETFWYVIGEGPGPNGQGGQYTIAAVQTDVGCTNPRSVVSMPDGLMFLSSRGLYLLTRDLGLVWIGRPVKDQLASFPNVTSAVLVASKNEVRFTCNNAGGTASTVLVYNYVEKQWTTARYTVGGVYGAPIADACMWNGVWTFVTTGGVVVSESDATWLDGAVWVPLTIETAWVNAAGPLAFQSVRKFALEGVSYSNHDLTVSVGFDSATAYPQTKTFLAGSSVTSIGPLEFCSITIGTRRKCQAIRFKVQDATPTTPGTYPVGTGRGPSFDMLGIEVGIKKGIAGKSALHMG